MLSTIVLGALSGALAGVLASLITRHLPRAKPHYRIIFVVLLVVLYAVMSATIGRALRARDIRSQAERVIEDDSAFRLLAQEEPEFKAHFIQFIVNLERQSASRDEVRAKAHEWGVEHGTRYAVRYLPESSDSAVLSFFTAFADVLKTLRLVDPSACVDYVFSPAPEAPRYFSRLSPIQLTAANQAFHAVVITAIRSPQLRVDSATGNHLVQLFSSRLKESYGAAAMPDLAALGGRTTVPRDPVRACNAIYAVVSTMLRMPPDQAAPLIRFLFSHVKY